MSNTVRTELCDLLGIEHPIVGFSPSEQVAAAVSRAGGLGVLGCVRFNDPAELDAALDWMDSRTPAGVRTASTWSCRPGCRPRARPGTWTG